eukprot:scaffold188754_cov26-Tisochrysis_lutea.AAC.2
MSQTNVFGRLLSKVSKLHTGPRIPEQLVIAHVIHTRVGVAVVRCRLKVNSKDRPPRLRHPTPRADRRRK